MEGESSEGSKEIAARGLDPVEAVEIVNVQVLGPDGQPTGEVRAMALEDAVAAALKGEVQMYPKDRPNAYGPTGQAIPEPKNSNTKNWQA